MFFGGTKLVLAIKQKLGIHGPPRLTHTTEEKDKENRKLASWSSLSSFFQAQDRLVAKGQQITDKVQMYAGAWKRSWRGSLDKGHDWETISQRSHAHTYLLLLLHSPMATNSITLVLRSNIVSFGSDNFGLRLFAMRQSESSSSKWQFVIRLFPFTTTSGHFWFGVRLGILGRKGLILAR